MKILALSALIAAAILSSGCSTLTASGTAQPVTVLTYTPDGKDLNEAKCELVNDEGSWALVTPNTSTINRSNKDLFVTCKKESFEQGTANVVSKTKGNMFGNIIFGGGIGAIIDHNNGSAYEYPATIKIVMGKSQRIEEGTSQAVEPSKETKAE